jgi:hypothetical protein
MQENMDDDILYITIFSQGPHRREKRLKTGLIAVTANSTLGEGGDSR